MKVLVYILTMVLLIVNNNFTKNQNVEVLTVNEHKTCKMVCCSAKQSSEKEPMSCCTDSFCMVSYSNVFVINESYSPELPKKIFVTSVDENKFMYKNQYAFHFSFDFWNPPRV